MRPTANAVAAWHEQQQWRLSPAWRLLNTAPWAIGFLRTEFSAGRPRIPLEEFHDDLAAFLKALRYENLPLNDAWQARNYADSWVRNQFLARPMVDGRFLYEPTAATARVLAFFDAETRTGTNLNSSRLNTLLAGLEALNQQTDPDPASRITALEAEIAEREAEIGRLRTTERPPVLPPDSAVAAARSILDLAATLPADFKRMRDGVAEMLHTIRAEIMESSVTKGVAVGQVLEGDRTLRSTAEGETFRGFTEFLNDPARQARFRQSVNDLLERNFVDRLSPEERTTLVTLVRELRRQAAEVHAVYGHLSENLHAYVQSDEFRESVQLRRAIHAAEQAVAASPALRTRTPVVTPLLHAPTFDTIADLGIFDPADHVPPPPLAAPPELSDADIRRTPSTPAPDLPALQAAVDRTRAGRDGRASLGDVFADLPPELRHINSLRGLVMAARHGDADLDQATLQAVRFTQIDGTERTAHLPLIVFTKDARP